MIIYLVRRYVAALPHDEYGVDDNYTLIGAFTDPVVANNVKERAQAKIEAQNQVFHRTLTQRLNRSRRKWKKSYPNEPFDEEGFRQHLEAEKPPFSQIDIINIEVDKQYDATEEPELGGGFYIE